MPTRSSSGRGTWCTWPATRPPTARGGRSSPCFPSSAAMRSPLLRLLAPPAFACAFGESSSAHEREFTQSRDWHLPFRGEHEFELRSFFDTSHGDFRGQIEYEYGVTSHFAFEPGIEIRENEDDHYEVEAAEV